MLEQQILAALLFGPTQIEPLLARLGRPGCKGDRFNEIAHVLHRLLADGAIELDQHGYYHAASTPLDRARAASAGLRQAMTGADQKAIVIGTAVACCAWLEVIGEQLSALAAHREQDEAVPFEPVRMAR